MAERTVAETEELIQRTEAYAALPETERLDRYIQKQKELPAMMVVLVWYPRSRG